MRLIPKNSKVTTKIWKSFSFLDVVLAAILFLVAFMIFMSNITWKIYLLFFFVSFSVMMFFESDGTRFYGEIIHILKFIVMPKSFTREHKKNNIDKLVPYTGLEEDGTICYGEYYSKVISVGSIEFRLLNEWMQNAKISALAKIFNNLSLQQSMQLVKLDQPIVFDEAAAILFDKLRAAEAEEPQDKNKINILRSRLEQVDTVNNLVMQYRPYYYFVVYDTDRSSLELTVDSIATILHDEGLEAEKLDIQQTAIFLKYCNDRSFDERDFSELSPSEYMDYIKPHSLKFSSTSFTVNDIKAFSYSISDYPLMVGNAWGASLFNIDNTKVVLNIRPLDKERAVKRIDKAVTEIGTRENINKASQAISQETHLETMGALLQNLQNGGENMFDCTLTVTGYNNEGQPEGPFRRQIRQAIVAGGFRVSSLRCRQLDAFVSSNITRHNALKSFERGINSLSLAAVFPFVFTAILEEDGICLGAGRYPVIWSPFKWKYSPDKYTNANCVILGKPGSGKSYFVKSILANLYSEESVTYVLDPENEYKELCENVNGRFIDVGNALSGRLNPFHMYDMLSDELDADGNPIPVPPEVVYYSHLRFLENFFQATLPGLNQDTLELINGLVIKCYEKRGIMTDKACANLGPEKYPVFDDLMELIVENLKTENNPMQRSLLQRAETYISKFAKGGRNSNLWNGASTLTAEGRFTVFNFQSLFAAKNNVIANGQMLLMLRFLEQQVINAREKNRGSGKTLHPIIVLDEGYIFLDPEHPIMLDFVYVWYKRIRKYDGMMVLISQNVKDFTGNAKTLAKTATILSNSQYHFVFSLSPGDVTDLEELYSNAGGINETEMNEISTASKGSVFMIASSSERTSFSVIATDEVVEMFTDKPKRTAEPEGEDYES